MEFVLVKDEISYAICYIVIPIFIHSSLRGTPLREDQTRRSHNIVFRRAECDWVTHWNSGTARGMYEQNQVG